MNRFMATCLIATVATLSVAACSGTPSTTPDATNTAPAVAPATTAPTTEAEETTSGQSVADACVSMSGPMLEASSAMAEIVSDSTVDPQAAVDSWTTLVDAFRSISETVTNPEVKEAATTVHQDLTAVRDGLQKIYVDGDMSGMSEFTTATTDWEASQTALMTLCSG